VTFRIAASLTASFLVCGFAISEIAESKIQRSSFSRLIAEGFEIKAAVTSPSTENPQITLQVLYIQKATSVYVCAAGLSVFSTTEGSDLIGCSQVTK
jgi:hypothetical protein